MTLHVSNLTVALPRMGRMQPVLEDFSLAIGAGEMVALVGESGSGKTTAALAIPRLLPRGARIDGSIVLEGQDLGALSPVAVRRVRGTRIGMVFQDALAAFNPVLSIGAQIAAPMRVHQGLSRGAAWRRAVALLDEVGIPDAAARARDAPHQFSGGMRQRAMIAAALACDPALLIADEPTAGLDPVLTEHVLALIAGLRQSRRLAVLLISHDLRLVARHAERVAVLYAGRCVEQGDATAVIGAPLHRYTRALLAALPALGGGAPEPIPGSLPEPEAWPPGCRFAPRCGYAQPACAVGAPLLPPETRAAACLFPGAGPVSRRVEERPPAPVGEAILRVRDLRVFYGGGLFGAPRKLALEGISFALGAGECLALVGASGAGKTTLKRALLGMVAHEGSIGFAGEVTRRRLQPVFQNPAASLDPSQNVGAAITEALVLAGWKADLVPGLLAQVGLTASLANRLPATLSGGQAQRVAIARALAADPALLLLDEPTASLDAATAAALLALLRDLASRRGLGYIVITHDLAMAAVLAHRVAVLEEGRVVEIAETATILRAPRHAATRALVAASWLAAP